MHNPAMLLAAALVAFATGAAVAQTPAEDAPIVACEVMGHDLVLFNRGSAPLPAGTVLHWSVAIHRLQGDHTLEAELVPFVGLYVDGALAPSYLWDRACVVEVVPAQPSAL